MLASCSPYGASDQLVLATFRDAERPLTRGALHMQLQYLAELGLVEVRGRGDH